MATTPIPDALRSRVVTACARAIGGGDAARARLFDFDAGDAAIAAYRAYIDARGK